MNGKSLCYNIEVVSALSPICQAALACIVAGSLNDEISKSGIGVELSDKAVAAMKEWIAGKSIPAEVFADLIHDYNDRGTNIFAYQSEKPISSAWNALSSALFCIAYYACLQQGKEMRSDVNEYSDRTLQHMFDKWKETPSFNQAFWDRTILLLKDRERILEARFINVDVLIEEIESTKSKST